MTLPKLVCFTGYKGSGKDTCAELLIDMYSVYIEKKIAEPVKEIVKYLFLLSDEEMENKETEVDAWGVSPRTLFQFIGTELFQYEIQKIIPSIGRNFWITRFIKELEESFIDNDCIVVSDLRFKHEYELLKKCMGDKMIVIQIENNRIIKNDDHISENEYKNIKADYILKNDDSIPKLQVELMKIFYNFNKN